MFANKLLAIDDILAQNTELVRKCEPGQFSSVEKFEIDIDKLSGVESQFQRLFTEISLYHMSYYEHYRSMVTVLGYQTFPLEKTLMQQLRNTSPESGESYEMFIDRHCVHQTSMEAIHQQQFLKFLLISYLYHLSLERVYFEVLKLPHDPIAERLFANGFALYVLLRKNFTEATLNQLSQQIPSPRFLEHCNNYRSIAQTHPFRFMRRLDDYVLRYNVWRLTLARIRRFYLSLQVLLQSLYLDELLFGIETYFRQCVAWLNFVYFLPRIFLDVMSMIYFVVSQSNEELGLWQRFLIFSSRRWELWLRDTIWLTNGILALFIFTGALGYCSLYAGALAQFCEAMLNLYLVFDFKQQITMIQGQFQQCIPDQMQRNGLLGDLRKRWDIDEQIRVIRARNSCGILVCNILIVPCFASISLWLPLLGAALSLLMSVIQVETFTKVNGLRQLIADPFAVSMEERVPLAPSRPLLFTT